MAQVMLEQLKKMRRRWLLLVATIIVMMFISIYQYSWSIFADGLRKSFKWDLAAIQLTFTLFTYFATFVQPFSGWFADRFGPRLIAIIASILVAVGYIASSTVRSLPELYLYYSLGSIGVGILYGLSAAIAVKWFPDRRGLATGLTTFGFGSGTAIFNVIINSWVSSFGVLTAFLYTGILMAIFILPFAILYQYPEFVLGKSGSVSGEKREKVEEKKVKEEVAKDLVNWRWHEMMKTHQWWLIYISFTIIAAIALLFGGNLKLIASELKIDPLTLSLALTLFPIANGLSRVLGGYISDLIGRQATAALFYALSGVFMLLLTFYGKSPILFLAFVILTMLFAGAVFAFNPAFIGDFYGPRYATTNYGITYTAKAWGGMVSGYVTAWLVTLFGTYTYSMIGLGIGSFIAAILVCPWILRKPMKK
jgi:OFA family oxalate/formate antiporter-like MFS transporter